MLDQLKTENTGNELSKILVYNSNYIQKCMRRESVPLLHCSQNVIKIILIRK